MMTNTREDKGKAKATVDDADNVDGRQAVRVKRDKLEPCLTCPLCDKLFTDATTVSDCLHTFCRKCITEKIKEDDLNRCPVCNVYMGTHPLDRLRMDNNLQELRLKIFGLQARKQKKGSTSNNKKSKNESKVARRSEPSHRQLEDSSVKITNQSVTNGRTFRRKNTIPKKCIITPQAEDPVDKTEDHNNGEANPVSLTMLITASNGTKRFLDLNFPPDDQPETLTNFGATQVAMDNQMRTTEVPGHPSPQAGSPSRLRASMLPPQVYIDLPNENPTKIVEYQAAGCSTQPHQPPPTKKNSPGDANQLKIVFNKLDELKGVGEALAMYQSESEDENPDDEEWDPKLESRIRKKASSAGIKPTANPARSRRKCRKPEKRDSQLELNATPESILDVSSPDPSRMTHPIWFTLVALEVKDETGYAPLSQIPQRYYKVSDPNAPVWPIKNHVAKKLKLPSESEVEIIFHDSPISSTTKFLDLQQMCMLSRPESPGFIVSPGGSAKEFVMVLHYAQKVHLIN
ncbi:hypothetical protein Droror1_Dr00007750 [Drosera rotundifolia]